MSETHRTDMAGPDDGPRTGSDDVPPTGPDEGRRTGPLWSVAALLTLAAGALVLESGRGSPSVGILLLVAGLASAGVALGSARYGPPDEGPLDLSARLGLGLLGGLIGGGIVLAVRWALVSVGITGALGVTLDAMGTGAETLASLGAASLWGMVLGILFPRVPGLTGASRGAVFSLFPSLHLLLWVYPLDRGVGFFGVGLGALTFAFVIGLNLLWGMWTGATIAWGATSDEAPVARPLAR